MKNSEGAAPRDPAAGPGGPGDPAAGGPAAGPGDSQYEFVHTVRAGPQQPAQLPCPGPLPGRARLARGGVRETRSHCL
jgi:hypothetical protein